MTGVGSAQDTIFPNLGKYPFPFLRPAFKHHHTQKEVSNDDITIVPFTLSRFQPMGELGPFVRRICVQMWRHKFCLFLCVVCLHSHEKQIACHETDIEQTARFRLCCYFSPVYCDIPSDTGKVRLYFSFFFFLDLTVSESMSAERKSHPRALVASPYFTHKI